MAVRPTFSFEMQGLIDAQQALRRAGGDSDAAAKLNRMIVEQKLIPPSKTLAPVRSGRLRNSILAKSSPQYGYILAGKKVGVPYAGVIHFGWATRGLGAGKLTGGSRTRGKQLVLASRLVGTAGIGDKALKRAGTRSLAAKRKDGSLKRHAIRGGPIKPNPFIYQAIDARRSDVIDAYNLAIRMKYEIEGLL